MLKVDIINSLRIVRKTQRLRKWEGCSLLLFTLLQFTRTQALLNIIDCHLRLSRFISREISRLCISDCLCLTVFARRISPSLFV